MRPLPCLVTAICALILAVSSAAAQSQRYDISDLGNVYPASINASGVVVGYTPYIGNENGFSAFVLKNGVLTELPNYVGIASSPPRVATRMRATDINQKGQVVGYAVVPSTTIGGVWGSGEVFAFLYQNGQTTFFAFPDGGVNHSSAYSISDRGLIGGLIYTPFPRGVLFDLKTGEQTTLVPLGGPSVFSITIGDVNDAGVAVGTSHLNANEYHAYRYIDRDGTLEDLGTGGTLSGATVINSHGTIAGESRTTTNDTHVVLWTDGSVQDLGTLGATWATVYGINKVGSVVGSSATSTGPQHAFITLDGIMTDLNLFLPAGSDWELAIATSINDAGQIIGIGTRNGVERAFLLTPSK